MNRTIRTTLVLTALVLLAFGTWWARALDTAPKDRIEVAGNVRSEVRLVVAPAIAYPSPDFTVGIPAGSSGGTSGSGAAGASGMSAPGAASSAAKRSAARTGSPAIAGLLATMTVTQGDRVEAGQTIALFDTALLDLGVEQAKAAERRARANVSLLEDNLDTIDDNREKLASAREKLASGKSQLTETRTELTATREDLVTGRKEAIAGRSALQAQIRQLESIPATLTPQQQAALTALKGKLTELDSGIAKMAAGLKQVDTGLAKIDAALAKMPSAAAQLSTARAALDDAEAQVEHARDTLSILVEGQRVAVLLAEGRLSAAKVTAPVAGVVTYARSAGTVVMVGAPVARIRPDGPSLVDTYLTGDQLARVRVGSVVQVTCDSLPGQVFEARIVRLGTASEFPPTSFPTDIVHMTRATRVTAALETSSGPPPGTPVDLTILTPR